MQGILLIILLHPWLQLAATSWGFQLLWGVCWTLLTSVGSIVVAEKVSGQGKKDLPVLALGLLISLALALLWRLPLALFLPLTLGLLYSGARFVDYPRRSFAVDWAWGSLFLIVTAIFESRLGYDLSLAQMLVFFTLGMLALIFWNATALEQEGLAPDYGGLCRTIIIFVVVVAGLALVAGVLLSPTFFQRTLDLLGKAYEAFMDGIVFLIVRPFAWLMSPLFRWADTVEKQEVPLEIPKMDRTPLERSMVEEGLDTATVKAPGWAGWILLTVIFFLIAWLVLRKLLQRQKTSTTSMVRETRESVFSSAEVFEDLRSALQTLVKPLARLRQPHWYRGEDPLLIIRSYYARFAVRAKKEVPFAGGTTPLEYAQKLPAEREGVNEEALQTLTMYYNAARYGEQGDERSVTGTRNAFRQVW